MNSTCDAIDEVYAYSAAAIISYGTLIITYDAAQNISERFNAGYITGSRIYSQENYARGLKFPDVIVLAGTADSLDMPTVGSMSDGFFEYNSMEDRLYDIRYELHVLSGVRHGFGSGSAYDNVPGIWRNVDMFLTSALSD